MKTLNKVELDVKFLKYAKYLYIFINDVLHISP